MSVLHRRPILVGPCRVLALLTLSAGVALFAMSAVEENGLWGYVSVSGEPVIAAQYLDAQAFAGGMAAVRSSSGWGYIDSGGAWVLPPLYEQASSFSEGLALVRQNGQRSGSESLMQGRFRASCA